MKYGKQKKAFDIASLERFANTYTSKEQYRCIIKRGEVFQDTDNWYMTIWMTHAFRGDSYCFSWCMVCHIWIANQRTLNSVLRIENDGAYQFKVLKWTRFYKKKINSFMYIKYIDKTNSNADISSAKRLYLLNLAWLHWQITHHIQRWQL